MKMVSMIFTCNRDLCMPILSSDTNYCGIVGWQATRSIAELKKTKFRKHTKNLSTHRELTWFGRLPTSTGKGGVFSASSQKEVHDTMLLDLFYSPRVHESLSLLNLIPKSQGILRQL